MERFVCSVLALAPNSCEERIATGPRGAENAGADRRPRTVSGIRRACATGLAMGACGSRPSRQTSNLTVTFRTLIGSDWLMPDLGGLSCHADALTVTVPSPPATHPQGSRASNQTHRSDTG